MKRYLLSIYQPDGPAPAPELLGPVMQRVGKWSQDLQAAGAWVFTGGLHPPDTATVVCVRDGQTLTTDGPFVEGKEHIGGFTVIDAPDLDVALDWGRRLAQALVLDGATSGLAVEVRPLQHG
jgi:hypothetical protein